MKILNPGSDRDYHIHSATLSDGLNSIDELVMQAGKLKFSEIAITDHCDRYMQEYGIPKKTHYDIITSGRWRNMHNDVRVIFGVEADLLNENGDVCLTIQGVSPEFVILSSHQGVYSGDAGLIKNGYLRAIKKYGSQITFLGHLCSKQFSDYLTPEDITEIVQAANEAGIALELNCANLVNGKTCAANLKALLACCHSLYVNSDSHTLYELTHVRNSGFAYLHQT